MVQVLRANLQNLMERRRCFKGSWASWYRFYHFLNIRLFTSGYSKIQYRRISKIIYTFLFPSRLYCIFGNIRTVSFNRCHIPNATRFVFWNNRSFTWFLRSGYCSFNWFFFASTNRFFAGNIFGQVSIFWRRISPYNAKHDLLTGIFVVVILWALLFVPVATFANQPMIDSFRNSITPN